MQVKLAELKPNPLRDFIVDPIDRATVDALRQSIHMHGFWGGIACRQLMDGTIEVACGHHRVQAALEEGVEIADVFVRKDVDNAEMVKLYAKENATQRTNTSSTAIAGTIASAVHYLTKGLILGTSPEFRRSSRSEESVQGRMEVGVGLGEPVITRFLGDVPGINKNVVTQQLGNLKASGDYARILAEVEQEILADHAAELQRLAEKEAAAEARREEEARRQLQAERERAEASQQEAKARAKRVVAKAAEEPKTFDFEGVAKYLKNAHQLAVFRGLVTEPEMLASLPVEQQADVARHLVEHAKREDKELTGRFLREQFYEMVLRAKNTARKLSRQEHAAWRRKDLESRADLVQDNFMRSVYSLEASAKQLMEFLHDEWPTSGKPFPWKAVLRKEFDKTKIIIDELATKL